MFNFEELQLCTPQEFEQLCFAYAQAKYGDKADVTLTPPIDDGGKDIEIVLIPTNIVHWGECKLHTRNIDLSSIGKNVVLVQSRNIRKIIFFSTKTIVYNTKKHITEVAKAHNFEAVFLDNENLLSEFAQFDIIQLPASNQAEANSKPVNIDVFAEEYTIGENAFNYAKLSKKTGFTLKASNAFSLFLLFKNRSFDPFTAKLTVDNSDKRFKIKMAKSKIKIKPFSDMFAEIRVESSIKYGESAKLPTIAIEVGEKTETYDLGTVKADFYQQIPLLGQRNYNFLTKIQSDFARSYYNVVCICGKKGIGKSRIVNELLQRFKEVKTFLFYPKTEKSISLLSIISFILDLPLTEDNKMGEEVFKAVLRSKKCDKEFIDLLSKYYLDKDALKPDELKAMFLVIIRYLNKKSVNRAIFVVFDDIMRLSSDSIMFLTDLIKSITCIISNIKIIVTIDSDEKKKNNEHTEILKNLLFNFAKEKKCFIYRCKELDDNDKLLFCQEILGKTEDRCAKLITSKYPGVPGILSNICFGLLPLDCEARVSKLNKLLSRADLYKACDELTKNLFTDKNGEYGEYVKTFCKWLILFQNKVPAQFAHKNSYVGYIQAMKQDMLIRYNLDTDTYSFYQEYSLNVLKEYFSDFKSQAEIILQWLETNKKSNLPSVKFICLMQSNRTEEAIEFGLSKLNEGTTDIRTKTQIAESLYYSNIVTQNKPAQYSLLKNLAHIYLFSNNFKEGVKFFKRAYEFSLNWDIWFENIEVYQIRHEYINSLIHCGKYKNALNTLKSIKEDGIKSLKHRFLLHNRLGVTNTFLYNIDDAKNNLQIAVQLANAMNDKFFLSTVYSDIAFIYLKTNQAQTATFYFEKAYSEHKACGYSETYRDIEINEQRAIAFALKKKFSKAQNYIAKAADICARNYGNFSLLKVNFVKAYINICTNSLDSAETIYNECITLAKIFGSDIQLIYANAGLAALYMLEKKDDKVKKLFEKLLRMLAKFEGIGAKLAIFKNFALWFSSIKDNDSLNKLYSLKIKELNRYIETIKDFKDIMSPTIYMAAHNAANFKGLSFLY